MGFSVSGPEIVAFLEWLRKRHPHVRSLEDAKRANLLLLIDQFTRSRSVFANAVRTPVRGYGTLLETTFRFLTTSDTSERSEISKQVERDFEAHLKGHGWMNSLESSSHQRGYDLIARYASVANKAIFLYTSQDNEFSGYIRKHWSAWSEESGDTLDFFDYSLYVGGDNAHTFARQYLEILEGVPGFDISKIGSAGLPCAVIWSGADYVIVPFSDAIGSEARIRDRFRAVQRLLINGGIDALQSAFPGDAAVPERSAEDIFLSYQHADADWVKKLHDRLEASGLGVWYDEHLNAGDRFDIRITRFLSMARKAVVVWSQNSISSGYVLAEALMALDRRILVPVSKQTGLSLPVPFNGVHYVNMANWPGDDSGLNQLRSSLSS